MQFDKKILSVILNNQFNRGTLVGLVLLIALSSFNKSFGQINISIGTASTLQHEALPIYTCAQYNYSQQIYTASEMIAGGALAGGQVTQIKIRAGSTVYSNTSFSNWTVYLGNTGLVGFPNATSWITLSSLTQVFTGSIPSLTPNGWMTLNFSTPFIWNGSNIVVAIYENSNGSICSQEWYNFSVSGSSGSRSLLLYSTTAISPTQPAAANGIYNNQRSQVQFTMQICNSNPSSGIASSSVSTACPNVNFTLSASGLTSNVTVQGISYQWQVSTDGGSTWANIAGATTSSISRFHSVASLYRIQTTCAFSGWTSTSSTVSVGYSPTPAGGTTSSNQSICIGDTPSDILVYGYSVGGYIQWQWSNNGATGWANLNGATSAQLPGSFIVSSLGNLTTTKYFRAQISNSCAANNIGYSTNHVIAVNPNPTASITYNSPLTICSNSPCAFTCSYTGASSFQWLLNNNNILGATSSSYSANQSGSYSVRATSTAGCSTVSIPVNLNVTPAPNINAGPDQQICIGDSVVLNAISSTNVFWSNGISNGVYFFPQSTASYAVSTSIVNGCISRDTVLVAVGYPSDTIINVSSLGPYVLNGISYNQSGTYTINTLTSAGCDSTIILNLIYYGTGIDETNVGSLLLVMPNPSSDGVFVLILQNMIASDVSYVRVYDQSGRIVFDASRAVEWIDLSDHYSGMYLLDVGLPYGRALQKLVIVR